MCVCVCVNKAISVLSLPSGGAAYSDMVTQDAGYDAYSEGRSSTLRKQSFKGQPLFSFIMVNCVITYQDKNILDGWGNGFRYLWTYRLEVHSMLILGHLTDWTDRSKLGPSLRR